jgi:hypothetical protein
VNTYKIISPRGAFYLVAGDAIVAMANAHRILDSENFTISRVDIDSITVTPFRAGG